MQIQRGEKTLEISLEEGESALLAQILREVASEYRMPPPELDPRVHQIWYPMDMLDAAGMSPDEKREWNEALRGFRGENLQRIEQWLSILGGTGNPTAWSLDLSDAEPLLAVMNDRRLALAAQYEVAESEMEHDLDRVADPLKRVALFEIHFLGWIIQKILEAIEPAQGV